MKKHIAERFIANEIKQLGWLPSDVLPNGYPVDYIMQEALHLSEFASKKEVKELIHDYINMTLNVNSLFERMQASGVMK